MNKQDNMVDAIQRIVNAKPFILSRAVNHICSRVECNPQNETILYEKGLIKTPPQTNHVFVCDKRAVHICDRDHCQLYQGTVHGTCPISGFHYKQHSFSNYKRSDPHTWNSKPSHLTCNQLSDNNGGHLLSPVERTGSTASRRSLLTQSNSDLFQHPTEKDKQEQEKKQEIITMTSTTATTITTVTTSVEKKKTGKKRKELTDYPSDHILQQGEELVRLLLFSQHRIRINDAERKRHLRARDKYRDDYIRLCKQQRQRAVLSEFARINIYFLNLPVVLEELESDSVLLDNYSYIIAHVWKLVNLYYNVEDGLKIDFTSVGLGTLYTMRQGYVLDGTEMLPQDPFLAYHLPIMKDLSRFGLNKRCITRGERLLSYSYTNAIESGASLQDLMVDFSRLKQSAPTEYKKTRHGRKSVIFLKE